MIGDIGLYSLIIVACLNTLMGVKGLSRFMTKSRTSTSVLESTFFTVGTRLSSLLSIFCLILLASAFLLDDFSLLYVSNHSNSQLPFFFKFAAVWGGHEGSMLFWLVTLTGWAGVISFQAHRYSNSYLNNVLWTMALLSSLFAWFTLFSSNPFLYNEILPLEGRDLNPMLQDIGLIFHPPLLYLGYVGYSTVLAFAFAALLEPNIEVRWVDYCRSWALGAWCLLTLGIVLGSWWAYHELGWGGWWFWDPVENASLLPWITGTALTHTLIASKRQKMLLNTSFILAFITFSLSILGTFIVRSGVLTSVHAFAVGPNKGIALLLILTAVVLSCMSLFLFRSNEIESKKIKAFKSKSYLILLCVGLLLITAITIFIGTFYPMLYELFLSGNISVGAPYFNLFVGPIAVLGLFIVGFVPFLKWQEGLYSRTSIIWMMFILSMALGSLLYIWQVGMAEATWLTWLFWSLACWVIVSHSFIIWNMKRIYSQVMPMAIAHIGFAILSLGAAMNSEHSFEMNYRLGPNDQVTFEQWQVTYRQTEWVIGPNYTAERAVLQFIPLQNKQTNGFTIEPERRHYPVRVMNMSEPALHSFWHGDLYITLGEKVSNKDYAIKFQYKSYIRWVWCGVLLFVLGGLLAMRQKNNSREVEAHEE